MTTPPTPPYTPLVRAGDWIVVSGQIGIKDGALVTGAVEGELRQAFANMRMLLANAGADLSHVVKTTVFLLHMRDYPLMNQVYAEEFGPHRPARSAVAVAELPFGAMVEIEAWAYVGS